MNSKCEHICTMRVVHLSTNDISGGAAKAAFSLHNALTNCGLQAHMIVKNSITDAPSVEQVAKNLPQKVLAQLAYKLDMLPIGFWLKHSMPPFWSPGWVGFSVHHFEKVRKADIVTLFWVCGGFLSLKNVGRLLRLKKAILWRLSDMWPFTGGCHYSGSCTRYENQCGCCPQLGSRHEYDLSRWVWKRKQRWWGNYPITIVCPSNWIAKCARRSSLFRNARIEIIPTGIDVNIFKPIEKELARSILNLPGDVPLILFGAIDGLRNPRKGGHYLTSALEILSQNLKLNIIPHLVVFGTWRKPEISNWNSQIHVIGNIHGDNLLALLYSASDVFVVPSVEDNLPKTALESISCGTPSVAFNVGGMADIIEHKKNGYLAEPFDISDLAAGIEWVLSDEKRHKELCIKAREKAVKCFDIKKIAKQYAELYREVLAECR